MFALYEELVDCAAFFPIAFGLSILHVPGTYTLTTSVKKERRLDKAMGQARRKEGDEGGREVMRSKRNKEKEGEKCRSSLSKPPRTGRGERGWIIWPLLLLFLLDLCDTDEHKKRLLL